MRRCFGCSTRLQLVTDLCRTALRSDPLVDAEQATREGVHLDGVLEGVTQELVVVRNLANSPHDSSV